MNKLNKKIMILLTIIMLAIITYLTINKTIFLNTFKPQRMNIYDLKDINTISNNVSEIFFYKKYLNKIIIKDYEFNKEGCLKKYNTILLFDNKYDYKKYKNELSENSINEFELKIAFNKIYGISYLTENEEKITYEEVFRDLKDKYNKKFSYIKFNYYQACDDIYCDKEYYDFMTKRYKAYDELVKMINYKTINDNELNEICSENTYNFNEWFYEEKEDDLKYLLKCLEHDCIINNIYYDENTQNYNIDDEQYYKYIEEIKDVRFNTISAINIFNKFKCNNLYNTLRDEINIQKDIYMRNINDLILNESK